MLCGAVGLKYYKQTSKLCLVQGQEPPSPLEHLSASVFSLEFNAGIQHNFLYCYHLVLWSLAFDFNCALWERKTLQMLGK